MCKNSTGPCDQSCPSSNPCARSLPTPLSVTRNDHLLPHLHVHTDFEGHPCADVPPQHVWDLVEFLNFHRPNATYHFDHDSFKVTFHGHSQHYAQQLLDRWSEAANTQNAALAT